MSALPCPFLILTAEPPYCGGSPCHAFPLYVPVQGRQQVAILLEGRILGIVRPDLLRGAEQEARLAGPDHLQIVVAVAGGDGIVTHGLEGRTVVSLE